MKREGVKLRIREPLGLEDLWMNTSITHDNICSRVHKKCHLNNYHSDVQNYITLNIIFSVARLLLLIKCKYGMKENHMQVEVRGCGGGHALNPLIPITLISPIGVGFNKQVGKGLTWATLIV